MDFKAYIMKGIELVKLNKDMAETISKDQEAFMPALAFFAIGGLASGIGGILTGGSITLIVVMPIAAVVGSFIGVGILYLLAKMFGGTGDFKGYYSALGVGDLPAWAGIVPFIGGVASLWMIPVAVIVTERVHKLPLGKAVAVVLIPAAVALLIGMAAFAGMMALIGMSGKVPGM